MDSSKAMGIEEQIMKAVQRVSVASVLCFLLSVPVYSHTQLSASIPADEVTLDKAPDEISLTFSAAVRLTAVAIKIDSESHSLGVDSKDPATDFLVALPELVPGEYVVQWRALSDDTHVVSGEIRFTVAS